MEHGPRVTGVGRRGGGGSGQSFGNEAFLVPPPDGPEAVGGQMRFTDDSWRLTDGS